MATVLWVRHADRLYLDEGLEASLELLSQFFPQSSKRLLVRHASSLHLDEDIEVSSELLLPIQCPLGQACWQPPIW
jgi:hypothetical protein